MVVAPQWRGQHIHRASTDATAKAALVPPLVAWSVRQCHWRGQRYAHANSVVMEESRGGTTGKGETHAHTGTRAHGHTRTHTHTPAYTPPSTHTPPPIHPAHPPTHPPHVKKACWLHCVPFVSASGPPAASPQAAQRGKCLAHVTQWSRVGSLSRDPHRIHRATESTGASATQPVESQAGASQGACQNNEYHITRIKINSDTKSHPATDVRGIAFLWVKGRIGWRWTMP